MKIYYSYYSHLHQRNNSKRMTKITVAKGDGIGPEIMDATLSILYAAEAQLEIDEIEIGEKVYLSGNTTGISPDAWDKIRTNKMLSFRAAVIIAICNHKTDFFTEH